MKNLLGLILLSVVLSACSNSCSRHNIVKTTVTSATAAPTVSVVAPSLPPVKIEGSNWSLELPNGFESLPTDKLGLEAFYTNKTKKELVSLIKESYSGTYKDYALVIMADLQKANAGADSFSAAKMGGEEAIQIECAGDGVHAWITSTVKTGQAYVLSCGGVEDDQKLKETCATVLSTLVIK